MSQLTFCALGGASEIGASCYYLGIEGHGVLLDCGVRPNQTGGASLPDLGRLSDLPVDCVLLTHAHLDHIGALPIVRKLLPEVRVYSTSPTREIARLMLLDAAKVAEQEGCPLFGAAEALEAAESIQPVDFEATVELGPLQARPGQAGHILGAAYYEISLGDYRILYTGDISITNQHTVEGAVPPAEPHRMDTVITESTYGSVLLPSRKEEIRAFVLAVQEVIGRGGRVLIPSFALGRAQEIILILLGAITSRDLPPGVPIYLDGLVRAVTDLYVELADYLPDKLCNFIKNSRQNPFLRDPVRVISSSSQRQSVISEQKPAIIIASSGMLSGGVSPLYAQQILREENSAIFFVGYQDEETPGGRLLALKRGDMINIAEEDIEVACSIEQYKLSAHADSAGLQNFLSRFPSHTILLVHGDQAARDNLLKAMKTDRVVWKVNNGDPIDPLSAPPWMTAAEPPSRGEPAKVEVRKLRLPVERRPDGSVALVFPESVAEMFEGIEAARTVLRRSPSKLTVEVAGNPQGEAQAGQQECQKEDTDLDEDKDDSLRCAEPGDLPAC